ncbi:MAG: hypothetical protein HY052_02345 [Proteobacteria bacterium]|nr:hypothetical protein [Pseudomonadota bacterium]
MEKPEGGPSYAYFIAGGRTLELIKKYEQDVKNVDHIMQAVADKYGAEGYYGGGVFLAHHDIHHPALSLNERHYPGGAFEYNPNYKTPEGQALQKEIEDIPFLDIDEGCFSQRLRSARYVDVNPDRVDIPELRGGCTDVQAATYGEKGGEYIVEVPIVFRRAFNNAAAPNGVVQEYFTPPDSRQISHAEARLKSKNPKAP